MGIFDLEESIRKAESRFGSDRKAARKPRSDAGGSRLPAPVAGALDSLVRGQERPRIGDLERALADVCRRKRLRRPARATIYRYIERCQPNLYRIEELPGAVQGALYNLGSVGQVPGHQLVFHAFQDGDARAMSFAAGLPWLDLYQAVRMRGWRPRSQGVLAAVMRKRAI